MASGDVDAFELLKEDLKDDEENVIATINRLLTVALAMGPKRTRDELIPFLQDFDENNEEALAAIARQLGDMVDFLGGAEHVPVLLPLLEKLASAEETVIRDMAVESFAKLVPKLVADDVVNKLYPLIKRLIAGEWFTNRISACAILPMIYPRLNPALQGEVRQLYQALSADDTPMVRKAAFAATGPLSTVMKKENVKEVILPALKLLADDAADATRVHFVDCVLAIAPLFVGAGAAGADGEFAECFVPSLEAVSEDQSWRVRSKFAKSVDKLAEVIGQTLGAQYVLPAYARLLRDSEPEVRSAACSTLLGVCRASEATAYKTHIVSLLAGLAADSSAPVRVAMSEALADLCPALGKDTSMQLILPVVLRMLKDDDAEVRLNVIAKIDVLSKVLGPDQLSATLAPAVIEMAQDAKWRVRLSVMEKLAHIGKQLGVAFFESSLKDLFLGGLADSVYAVRTSAAEQIRPLIETFGVEWSCKKLLPPIMAIYDSTVNYLHRMVPVVLSGHLVGVLPADALAEIAVPLVLKACKDQVSNVRLAAARSLEKLIPALDATLVQNRVKPVLNEMKSDSDADVQYFSGQAMKKC